MKRTGVRPATVALCILSLLLFSGCPSPNIRIDSAHPLPDAVKAYKHVVLNAGASRMLNTGLTVSTGNLVTVMASGRLDYCPRGNCKSRNVHPEDGWPLMVRIGTTNSILRPLAPGSNGYTFTCLDSGDLYVGYRQGPMDRYGVPKNPEFYRDDSGVFFIDLIVWRNDDFAAVAGFLEQQKARNPSSKPLADALGHADVFRRLALARAETSKEVEKTRSEIQQIKTETARPSPGAQETPGAAAYAAAGDQRVKTLEARLEQLQADLAKLELTQRQLDEERRKSQELTVKLEEQQAREKTLLSRIADGGASPPVLLVASPADGLSTEAGVVLLNGAAEDDKGLQHIEIRVNDRLLERSTGRGLVVAQPAPLQRIDFSQRLNLETGPNRIVIRAVDSDGLSAEKTLTVTRIRKRTNVWAVVIGINEYPNVAPLKYAVNDARAFYRYLIDDNRLPAENVTLLIDGDATLDRLRSVLGTQLKNRAGQDDMVIIYFAGHGATERDTLSPDGDGLEKYILPYQADLKDLYATAMPMREVAYIFTRIRSERLIFIADACYSGASGGRTVGLSGIRAAISENYMERIAGGKGRVVITASGANEVSIEDERYRHGVFTYFLLEGLQGKADADADGLITVDEAYRFVSDRVTRATGQEQHPVKKGAVEGQLVLGVLR